LGDGVVRASAADQAGGSVDGRLDSCISAGNAVGHGATIGVHSHDVASFCEEVALIFGQHDVSNAANARLGLTIVQLGRSEAVPVYLVAQRGTVTMLGSGDLKSQLENTFGLGVADANDARYIFGDTKIAADLAKFEHPGTMLVQAGQDTRILPAKAWWVAYDEIGRPGGIAERNTPIGPDPGSAAPAHAAGGYHDRWSHERAGHLMPGAQPQPTTTYQPPTEPQTTAEKLGLEPSKLIPSPVPPRRRAAAGDEGPADPDCRRRIRPPPIATTGPTPSRSGSGARSTPRKRLDQPRGGTPGIPSVTSL
jgi:hypothetical protein